MDNQDRRGNSDDYFNHDGSAADSYVDKATGLTVIKVYSGDCYVTDKTGSMMVTVLGSCIAACIRDPIAGVGGMNHFLLPDGKSAGDAPMRYGAYAMEQLINDIMKKGGRKSRMEVKIFGGGNVIESSARIGDKNVQFVKHYLRQENLPIKEEDVGGTSPRRIHYYPDTGKVMMRRLNRKEDYENVNKEEKTYSRKITEISNNGSGDVELF